MAERVGFVVSHVSVVLFVSTYTWRLLLTEGATVQCINDAPTKQDLTNIRDRIGSSYADVGICLLNDDTGQLIDAIIVDKRESKYILDEIFRRWMTGEGKECSWEGLIECLRFAKLIVLAEDLESACARENKHTDPPTETFSTLPSSTPTPRAKEEQIDEQIKHENDTESSIYVIFSTVVVITVLSLWFGCSYFNSRHDSISGRPKSEVTSSEAQRTEADKPEPSSGRDAMARPNSANLTVIRWKNEHGEVNRFRLKSNIYHKWRNIGDLVCSRQQLDVWAREKDSKECCDAVLYHWLDHPTRHYPATWKGLYELLDDSELSQIAVDLKTAVEKAI